MKFLCLFKHDWMCYHRRGKLESTGTQELNSGQVVETFARPMVLWRKCRRCGKSERVS